MPGKTSWLMTRVSSSTEQRKMPLAHSKGRYLWHQKLSDKRVFECYAAMVRYSHENRPGWE